MPTTEISFPPEVSEILAALVPGVRAALGENLVGVYLRGSLATGDFIDTSDLDFLVVTEGPVSDPEFAALTHLHARLAALPNKYANRLEGAYIDRLALKRFQPGQRHPTVHSESPLSWQDHGYQWKLERWVLREKGVTLLGPDPRSLVDPIPAEELREAVRARLRDWARWAAQPDDPDWLPPRSHQAYVVETMCRALYTLVFGDLVSKQRAAAWAVSVLPEPWPSLVESSVAGRADPTPAPAAIPDVLRFVEWVAAEGAEPFALSLSKGHPSSANPEPPAAGRRAEG